MRSFLVLALVGSLGFLAGCSSSGSGGTPVGVATSITLSPSNASVNAGQSVNIVATLINDSSGKGVSWTLSGAGTLSNETHHRGDLYRPEPGDQHLAPSCRSGFHSQSFCDRLDANRNLARWHNS